MAAEHWSHGPHGPGEIPALLTDPTNINLDTMVHDPGKEMKL